MTDKQDPITHAARLLREAAEELRQAHTLSSDRDNWIGEPEAKPAYDEHMAAAQALEDWEAAVGAGGVQALSAAPANPLTISPLEEQQMFDDWCPYRGNPDPRTVWAAAIEAVNGMQLCAASPTAKPPAIAPETGNTASAQGATITSESSTPPAEQTADPDGEAFRNAARLGLTLRFYGSCAQSSMPGTPSAYVVTQGSDRAEAMREAVEQAAAIIASGGEAPKAPLAPPAEQQAAPRAEPGELSYSEKWDAELGRTAMRFVDRAGDVHPGIDDAETICAEFHKAMSEVIERMPHVRRMTPHKEASEVGNSGFDHKTAADLLNNKTVSDEAVRKFVAVSRWAHDERAALSATLLAMHGVLTSREAEIALLKKALLEAEAAPQQEAQEPVAWLNPWRADQVTTDYDAYGERGIPLYAAPLPAPAPLSEMPYEKRKAVQEGEQISASDAWFHARHNMLDTLDRRNVFRAGFDRGWNAALAAQGGKDA